MKIITHKWEQSDDGSTLALKPTVKVNRSLKERAPVASQNGDLSPQKNFKKKKKCVYLYNLLHFLEGVYYFHCEKLETT